jgi:hypothetical protein
MKFISLFVASLLLTLGISKAEAAQVILNLNFVGPDAVNITCPVQAEYIIPLTAGSQICHYTVAPTAWQGTVTLGGPDAALFVLVPTSPTQGDLKIGATAITTVGIRQINVTASP